MKVVLLKDIAGVGKAGEIKEVSSGHALNYLLPNKLGRVAKQSDLNRKNTKSFVEKSLDQRTARYKKLKKQIDGMRFTLSLAADEQGHLFGSVSVNDILKVLKQKNIDINPKLLRFEHIKEVGEHVVTVDFKEVGTATLKVTVVAAS